MTKDKLIVIDTAIKDKVKMKDVYGMLGEKYSQLYKWRALLVKLGLDECLKLLK